MVRSAEPTGPGGAALDAGQAQISEALTLTADVDQVLKVLVELAPFLKRIRRRFQEGGVNSQRE